MTTYLGIDIGGTKIAAGAFTEDGVKLCEVACPTPPTYDAFFSTCQALVAQVSQSAGVEAGYRVGVSSAGAVDSARGSVLSENIPYLTGKALRDDLAAQLGCPIKLANDMNCMALAEALDGAGQGFDCVHGITLSTGVGSGLVVHGHIVEGRHGLTGEMGHLPLPFREKDDAPLWPCICRQDNCIEKAICGGGLSRLYKAMTGQEAEPPAISDLAEQGDNAARMVMDRYYHMVAKAMVTSLHFIDPDVIVLSGGLSRLPRLCEEVMARWGQYCLIKDVKTKLVLAAHGPTASLRGAAWLWR